MGEHTIKKLLECGFEEINEDEIYEWVDEDELETLDISEFGFLDQDSYTIVKFNKNINDAFLYSDGNNEIIIKYNNKVFYGGWNEIEHDINEEEGEYLHEEFDIWEDFKKEMIKNKINTYFIGSF